MKFGNFKLAPFIIAAGVVAFICLVQAVRHDFLERLERMTYDWRVRQSVKFPCAVTTNLGFVAITDETITRVNDGSINFNFGLYWPRHIYGRVVRELSLEGAKAVAFDVLFDGRRYDQLPVLLPNGSDMGSDEYFAAQLKRANNVIISSDRRVVPPRLFRKNALALGDISSDKDSDGILRHARAFKTYRKWHRAFQQTEDNSANGVDLDLAIIETNRIILPRPKIGDHGDTLTFLLNKDGNFDLADFVGTNIPPGMARFDKPFTDERMWNMGILLAAQELKLDLAHAEVELDKGRITLHGPDDVTRVIPVDKNGFLYINWCLPPDDKRLTQEPFQNLLARDQAHLTGQTNVDDESNRFREYLKDPAAWRHKLVIIGSSATGNDLTDKGATSLAKDTLLVSTHWNVANSVLTGKFIHKSPLSVEWLLIIFMGALATLLTQICRSWVASVWVLASLAGYIGISLLAYGLYRYWLPVVLPLDALVTTHVCLLGYLIIFEQAERRRVRSVFTRVVSPDVVTELLRTEKLSLTGARRKVTVFFSDIRGFTEMTDQHRDKAADYIREHKLTGAQANEIEDAQARDTLNTVNLYLSVIADVVLKHNGTVDKFIGDCVMAFWGAPVLNQHHALFCVRAAIDTQRAVYKLNQQREAENRSREATNLMLAAEGKPLLELLPILVVGTGINTGDVTVGLMGSDERLNYTVFGREVNLASRLETVSGRSRIIISEATLAEIIQDDSTLALSCKPLPPEKVKGIREPVPIFEVPWREGDDIVEATSLGTNTQVYNTGYITAADRTE